MAWQMVDGHEENSPCKEQDGGGRLQELHHWDFLQVGWIKSAHGDTGSVLVCSLLLPAQYCASGPFDVVLCSRDVSCLEVIPAVVGTV